MTILLVDDSEAVITIWKHFIEPLNAKVLVARNIQEAILMMQTIPPPDLVLLDLVLPPHRATETALEISTLRRFNPNLAVIAVSGLEKKEILKAIAGVDVQAALTKEEISSQISLLSVIKEVLGKSKKSSQLLTQVGEMIQNIKNKA